MSVYESLCASIGVYGSIWKFMEVWMNMNSGWVYQCGVCTWYVCVFMGICEFLRIYGSLWRDMGMGPKQS